MFFSDKTKRHDNTDTWKFSSGFWTPKVDSNHKNELWLFNIHFCFVNTFCLWPAALYLKCGQEFSPKASEWVTFELKMQVHEKKGQQTLYNTNCTNRGTSQCNYLPNYITLILQMQVVTSEPVCIEVTSNQLLLNQCNRIRMQPT